jgi:hypothetical protein
MCGKLGHPGEQLTDGQGTHHDPGQSGQRFLQILVVSFAGCVGVLWRFRRSATVLEVTLDHATSPPQPLDPSGIADSLVTQTRRPDRRRQSQIGLHP